MKKRIIIIGGMGPQASLDLHGRLLDGAIKRGARNGGDFPDILHLSLPVPDFIDGTGMTFALDMLKKNLECLYLWRKRPVYCGL